MKKLISTALTVALLATGCSLNQHPRASKEASMAPLPYTVDLFAARGELNGGSYERYFLKDNTLWRECGNVTDTANAENLSNQLKVFTGHPNLKPKDSGQITLTAEQKSFLIPVLNSSFGAAKDAEPAPTGKLFGVIGKGVFEVSFEKGSVTRSIKGSVGDVADPDSTAFRNARELFSVIRGYGPVMCNNLTFFSIPRETLH